MPQIDAAEIDKRFDYHAPDAAKQVVHENVRAAFKELATEVSESLPESREKSLAFTALEEALMWANAAIARHKEE